MGNICSRWELSRGQLSQNRLTLLRKTKKLTLKKLNITGIGGNKIFWKTVCPISTIKTINLLKLPLLKTILLQSNIYIYIYINLNSKAPLISTTDDILSLIKSCENQINLRKIEGYPEIVPDSCHLNRFLQMMLKIES